MRAEEENPPGEANRTGGLPVVQPTILVSGDAETRVVLRETPQGPQFPRGMVAQRGIVAEDVPHAATSPGRYGSGVWRSEGWC